MVKFSCFHTRTNPQKQKVVKNFAEALQKLEDCSRNQKLEDVKYLASTNPMHLKMGEDHLNNSSDKVSDFSPVARDCRSEEIEHKGIVDCDELLTNAQIKKSRSLGSVLNWEHRISGDDDLKEEVDPRFSCDGSHKHCGSVVSSDGAKELGISPPDQFQEAGPSDYFQLNSDLKSESVFTTGDAKQSEKEGCGQTSNFQLSGEGESADYTDTPHVTKRSNSLPNLHSPARSFSFTLRRVRSLDDLGVLNSKWKESPVHDVDTGGIKLQGKDDVLNNDKISGEHPADDSYNDYVGSAKDWIIPVLDEEKTQRGVRGEFSSLGWVELPSKDFRTRRIQDWVMDLQHLGSLEESNDLSTSCDKGKGKMVLDASPPARLEDKLNPGMEAVKKYISSLSASSPSAQLSNQGLVIIPFLSAFVTLKALNLSGNAIVKITAGALPRGLHVLNLSRNKITTIEGLRELTRLRVLDISYNRLLRIGHGLASCSSLKELYLAGNKISEVEGLHRLLKLNVLDLRFNKISTTKCLGQLAANYNSLQAISLEGNPAQKNVGDEQLKKHLLGLLPHLTYFNRQLVKTVGSKDTADRSSRLAITSHQTDRAFKSDLKTKRKGTHGTAAHKVLSSSNHGRKVHHVDSPTTSRSRHGRLPLCATKSAADRHHVFDFSNKLFHLRPDLSIPKSRSVGNLGAL